MGYAGDNQNPKSAEKRVTSGGVWKEIFNRDPGKAFHALKAGFLREHKKYQKERKLLNKGWKFYESMLVLKNEPTTCEKFYMHRATDKICCGKTAAFSGCVQMRNAARGP